MGLVADFGHSFNRFVICAIAGPDAGALLVRMSDRVARRLTLRAPAPAPHCETIRAAAAQTAVTVTASEARVTITSWATFRDGGGVALSNLGVAGSQLRHFGRTDDSVLREELRAYAPDLIVLAFGTNEGFVPHFDATEYEEILRDQIARLMTLAPGVPLLLLGPPDALSHNSALRGNADGAIINCPNAGGTPEPFVPPALAQVRDIQRAVATDLGIAWWDWQQRMGGPCSAVRWAVAVPPLMRADTVHFRLPGGEIIARRLQDDLNNAAAER